MTTFTWLHLSDLHLCGKETSVDRGRFENMLLDIKTQQEGTGLKPDAVFFTGDIAFSGQQEQYDLAGSWFDKILEICHLSGQRDKFFFVPGNHDVSRSVVEKPDYVREQYQSFAAGLLDSHKPYSVIDKFLGDDEHKKWAFTKFQNFARFTSSFGQKFDHQEYYSVRPVEKDGYAVVVIGLNSAWLSFQDGEQGKLLLGEIQVCDALEKAQKEWPNARLCIALVHHPLYWLAEKDIHRVQQHLPGKCDVLLRGHLHCPSFSIQSTPDSHLYEFAAGASLRAEYHAYNLVQLNLDTGAGIAILRLQHPEIGGKWGADSFTYRNAKEGKINFTLPLRGSKATEV
jgi:predicted phosphodiesterase